MKVKDIARAIEAFAPTCVQEGWDNSGLIVGSPEDEVGGVMVGFDCTPALIDEALRKGCNMVVTHHPLIFKGIRTIDPEDPVGCAIYKAIRGGVAVYAAHTSADKVRGGVSWAMAERLGLENVTFLEGEEYGLGVIGDLPCKGSEAGGMTGEEAIAFVKDRFGLSSLRCSAPVPLVRKVALCGGSGGSLIGAAMAAGAQLYVSGDISYHQFFTRPGFMIADIGHFEGEVDIVDVLSAQIRKNLPSSSSIPILSSSSLENPVKYR